ncbi:MAG: LemA family protein [Magnetococcus sp. DMHC-1]|nr:LemA family protein [Magnetococcales bacterium]
MAEAKKEEDDLEPYATEPLNDERLRRMKRLLRDMYRDEIANQKLHLPPIRARFLIVLLSFVSILVFGITTLYNFNRFVTLEERVLSAEGHVQDVIQRRRNLFHNLINMTLNNAMLEQDIVQQVTSRRTEIGRTPARENTPAPLPAAPAPPPSPAPAPAPESQEKLAQLLKGSMEGELSKEAMAKLLAIVEQYPSITTTVTYQQLMDKLVELEDRISHRRDEYNEEVRVYNTLITSFPWYFLARITGFRRAAYYHASHEELPQMSPERFIRLLPRNEKGTQPAGEHDADKKARPPEKGSHPQP